MHDFILLLIELGYKIDHTSTFSFYEENILRENRYIIDFSSEKHNYSLFRFFNGSYELYINENKFGIKDSKTEKLLVYETDAVENMVDFLRNGFNPKNKVKA